MEGLACHTEAVDISATVFIGLALTIFVLSPLVSHALKESESELDTTSEPHFYTTMDAITVILKIDVLFSAILVLSNASNCNNTTFALSISFFFLCLILVWGYMGVLMKVTLKNKRHRVINFFFLFVFVCYPLHILMNNSLPIDCGFGCSHVIDNIRVSTPICNTTSDGPCCDQKTKSGVRLAFSVINFLVLLGASVIFGSESYYSATILRTNRGAQNEQNFSGAQNTLLCGIHVDTPCNRFKKLGKMLTVANSAVGLSPPSRS